MKKTVLCAVQYISEGWQLIKKSDNINSHNTSENNNNRSIHILLVNTQDVNQKEKCAALLKIEASISLFNGVIFPYVNPSTKNQLARLRPPVWTGGQHLVLHPFSLFESSLYLHLPQLLGKPTTKSLERSTLLVRRCPPISGCYVFLCNCYVFNDHTAYDEEI